MVIILTLLLRLLRGLRDSVVKILSSSQTTLDTRPNRRALALGAVVLGLAVFVVYYPSLDGPFVFDDASTVVDNPSIRQLWPLVGDDQSPAPLTPPAGTAVYARPLVNLSLAINYHFGQLDPRGYRAVNVFLHFLSALVLWSILARTLRLELFRNRFATHADSVSLAAALIWAVHPLATESVVYVTQRTELMMGLCYLSTVYCAIRYWSASGKKQRGGWLLLATGACLSGMLSKEMIASAPAMVLLYERLLLTRPFGRIARESWPLYVGLSLSWLVAIALNFAGQQTPKTGFALGVAAHEWWFTQAKVFFMYLKLAVWPWPLVVHYEVPYLKSLASAWPWLLAAGCYAVVAIALLRRQPAMSYAMIWVVAVLSPTLLIPLVGETVAERRMYVPLVAIVALLVLGGYRLLVGAASSRASTLVVAPALLLAWCCGWLSHERLEDYRSELALWQDAVEHQPHDPLVQANLGISLTKENRLDEAAAHFIRWVELEPDSHWAHYNLARSQEGLGRTDEAIVHYRQAIELLPEHAASHNNLARLLEGQNKWPWAIKHYRQAIAAQPDFATAHTNLGLLLQRHGDVELAIEHFAAAARLQNDLASNVNLTLALLETDRRDEVRVAAEKSLALAEAAEDEGVAAELRRILHSLE